MQINMRHIIKMLICIILIANSSCTKEHENKFYRGNPAPLLQNACIRLPLGAVKPEGWLKKQLQIQASGLTGNIDDFWPDLVNSAWHGGDGDAWERGPYYLDGLIPLAYLLNDERLIKKAKYWIENILASSTDSGWYGPSKNKDRWPLSVANKVLIQYYEITGDKRVIDVLTKYYNYLKNKPPDWPDKEWRGVRAMENSVTGYWLYRQNNSPLFLETIASIQKNCFDWTRYFEEFPWDSTAVADKKIPIKGEAGLTAHAVNNAMAIKYPGLWYQQAKDERFKKAVSEGLKKLDKYHGQAGGRFSGDEHLSGNSPVRGTELCSVVELMYSLENLYEVFGDNSLADRIELLAFNSLPGATTPDMWAHQYDQQSNQVLVSAAKRDWISNGDFSNIYGLMPDFACCLANMHQGWPKFTASMWMATNDNGLIAVCYGPSVVKARVGNGDTVTVREETDYPFNGKIKFKISSAGKIKFPISLRIPGWAEKAEIKFHDKNVTANGGETIRLKEKWRDGDEIILNIPMKLRYETRFNKSISLLRGPIYLSLRIDKEYKKVKLNYDNFSYKGSVDWEINPKSPWNYGLIVDKDDLMRGTIVSEFPIGAYPFADRGDMIWSADSSRYIKWEEDAPLMVKIRGMKLNGWTMVNNSAGDTPVSPVSPVGDPEALTLVPYGSAKLRITEFPVMDIMFMKDLGNR
jgi:uncharacterized protein